MTKRFTPIEIAAQRSIKDAFDPIGLLNPGIMLPDPSASEPAVRSFGVAVRDALTGRLIPNPESPLTAGGDTDITVNLGNLSLIVGAEATVEQINAYLADHSVACAAIPTTEVKRTIGELVATAKGDERIEIRHALLGADVILVDEDAPARFGGENMKDVAGYDAKRLFIGGCGTFGAITNLIFKIAVKT
jgi:glycolate oxidase